MGTGLAGLPMWGEGFPQRDGGAWRCGVVGSDRQSAPATMRDTAGGSVGVDADAERMDAIWVDIFEGDVCAEWLDEWRGVPGVIVSHLDEERTRAVLLGPRKVEVEEDSAAAQAEGPLAMKTRACRDESSDCHLLALPPVLNSTWLKSAAFIGGPVPILEEHYVFGVQRAMHGVACTAGATKARGGEHDRRNTSSSTSQGKGMCAMCRELSCESFDAWGFQSWVETQSAQGHQDDDAIPSVGSVSNFLDWQPVSPSDVASSTARDNSDTEFSFG